MTMEVTLGEKQRLCIAFFALINRADCTLPLQAQLQSWTHGKLRQITCTKLQQAGRCHHHTVMHKAFPPASMPTQLLLYTMSSCPIPTKGGAIHNYTNAFQSLGPGKSQELYWFLCHCWTTKLNEKQQRFNYYWIPLKPLTLPPINNAPVQNVSPFKYHQPVEIRPSTTFSSHFYNYPQHPVLLSTWIHTAISLEYSLPYQPDCFLHNSYPSFRVSLKQCW